MGEVKYRFSSLEDFLITKPLSIDGELDDGWGARFPVKGREIQASILFADISGFSRRTLELSPTETLIFVNNFFTWITAEALQNRPGIIDKYIGDEIMVVFSNEFGSEDAFLDALQTARWMAENDALSFCPHIGIASGIVTVGYVGSPLRYNCSVFGKPVTLAARCASIRTKKPRDASIAFPAELWKGYSFKDVFPPKIYEKPDGSMFEQPSTWEIVGPHKEEIKNMPDIEVIMVEKTTITLPGQPATERAKEALRDMYKAGIYKPRPISSTA